MTTYITWLSLKLRYTYTATENIKLIETTIDAARINFTTETLWVLNLILALIMFGVALNIGLKDFRALIRNPKPVFVGFLSQFVFLPLITFVLILLIRPMPSMALGMILVAACPGGNISNFISSFANGNRALSVALTANATLLAIVLTPLNFSIWASLYPPTKLIMQYIAISPMEMIEVVALILGIPLAAGVWLREQYPSLAVVLSKYLKMISLCFFIGLILVVVFNNRTLIQEYLIYVFWLVLLHNALAYLTGFSLAKLSKLPAQDVRAITVETGIQNSGLGLVLIFTFFDGLGGMAILTAFWGIWHLISGLVLGTYWAYKPLRKEVIQ
jgi:BASS family bile acid:Na+ symporter